MNWPHVFLWGFAATAFLTTALSASQSLGWTRMSITFMLGSMWTADRDRAKVIGFAVHFLNGWLFALVYALFFQASGITTWWSGGLMGTIHGGVVLLALLPLLPGVHPRMASESAGPEPTPLLEPPGFLALNYGVGTPLVTMAAHVSYGIILGAFYRSA